MIPAGVLYTFWIAPFGERKAFVYAFLPALLMGLSTWVYVGHFVKTNTLKASLQALNAQISNELAQNVFADKYTRGNVALINPRGGVFAQSNAMANERLHAFAQAAISTLG
jgi:hypothetical protein